MGKPAEETTDEVAPRFQRREGEESHSSRDKHKVKLTPSRTGLSRPAEQPKAREPAPARSGPAAANLRCLWHTRLVVPAERTVTGTRYQFDAGQVQAVNPLDAPGLLSMEHKQSPGCCGNDPNPPPLKFFERA